MRYARTVGRNGTLRSIRTRPHFTAVRDVRERTGGEKHEETQTITETDSLDIEGNRLFGSGGVFGFDGDGCSTLLFRGALRGVVLSAGGGGMPCAECAVVAIRLPRGI